MFSDGRFLVVETHKFDGRVLSFEVLARKKRLNISKPTYVSQNELNAVYSIAERSAAAAEIEEDSDLDQLQMQKDFVAVVERRRQESVGRARRGGGQHADYVSYQRYDADRNGV